MLDELPSRLFARSLTGSLNQELPLPYGLQHELVDTLTLNIDGTPAIAETNTYTSFLPEGLSTACDITGSSRKSFNSDAAATQEFSIDEAHESEAFSDRSLSQYLDADFLQCEKHGLYSLSNVACDPDAPGLYRSSCSLTHLIHYDPDNLENGADRSAPVEIMELENDHLQVLLNPNALLYDDLENDNFVDFEFRRFRAQFRLCRNSRGHLRDPLWSLHHVLQDDAFRLS